MLARTIRDFDRLFEAGRDSLTGWFCCRRGLYNHVGLLFDAEHRVAVAMQSYDDVAVYHMM